MKTIIILSVFAGSGILEAAGAFGGAAGGFAMPNAAFAPDAASSSNLATVEKIRNVFPETWFWTNSTVGYICCQKRILAIYRRCLNKLLRVAV